MILYSNTNISRCDACRSGLRVEPGKEYELTLFDDHHVIASSIAWPPSRPVYGLDSPSPHHSSAVGATSPPSSKRRRTPSGHQSPDSPEGYSDTEAQNGTYYLLLL